PAGEQDVLWLDVPVHHIVAVGVAQGARHLPGNPHGFLDGQLRFAVQPVPQRFPLQVGHHIVEKPVGLAGVVQGEDMGMGEAHRGQKRESGDDYVSHSVAVATILAEQLMDSTTIAAALLHDVVEDSDTSLEDIRRDFGAEVAELVDGLTKLSTLTFRSTAEEQAENYRKLLLSVAKDARVIIIKLADRLHNMRTLEHLDVEKQRRIALETREIY